MQISEYYVKLGFRIDQQQLKLVDGQFRKLEQRLRDFGKRFDVLNKKLRVNVKLDTSQLDRQIKSIKFPAITLSNFKVDTKALQSAVSAATKQINQKIPLKTQISPQAQQRLQPLQQHWQRQSSGFSTAFGIGSGGGFGVGMLARMGPVGTAATAAIAAGMYGASKMQDLNELNQRVMNARASLTNTLASFNMSDKEPEWFKWIRSNSDRLGVDFLGQMPELSKSIANGFSLGLSKANLQEQIVAQMEFGRANNMSQDQMKRFQLAWNQIQATGRLQGDEMNQMADSGAAGINGLFAKAWANITKSGKVDAAAMKQLLEDRQKGLITSDKILPEVARLMRERAAPTLEAASKTSTAMQARFQNTQSDFALRVSESGMEEGFARLFASLNSALERISPLAESLGKRFNSFSESLGNTITKASEAFAIFNNYGEGLKTSFPPELVAMIRSVSDGISAFSSAIGNLYGHLKTILSSPLFQTLGKIAGGAMQHLANTVDSVGHAYKEATSGNFKQAGKELVGATPFAMLPQITSPAEQRIQQEMEQRQTTLASFTKFNQLGSNVIPFPQQSERVQMLVQNIEERGKASKPFIIQGKTGSLPSIQLNQKGSIQMLPQVFEKQARTFQQVIQREGVPPLQLTDNILPFFSQMPPVAQLENIPLPDRQSSAEQVVNSLSKPAAPTVINFNPSISINTNIDATTAQDMTHQVTELFRIEFQKELSGVLPVYPRAAQ